MSVTDETIPHEAFGMAFAFHKPMSVASPMSVAHSGRMALLAIVLLSASPVSAGRWRNAVKRVSVAGAVAYAVGLISYNLSPDPDRMRAQIDLLKQDYRPGNQALHKTAASFRLQSVLTQHVELKGCFLPRWFQSHCLGEPSGASGAEAEDLLMKRSWIAKDPLVGFERAAADTALNALLNEAPISLEFHKGVPIININLLTAADHASMPPPVVPYTSDGDRGKQLADSGKGRLHFDLPNRVIPTYCDIEGVSFDIVVKADGEVEITGATFPLLSEHEIEACKFKYAVR